MGKNTGIRMIDRITDLIGGSRRAPLFALLGIVLIAAIALALRGSSTASPVVASTAPAPQQESEPTLAPADDSTLISAELPLDVDLEELQKLDPDTQIPEAQRLFDIFAWQSFVALNWPATDDGQPDLSKGIGDNVSPRVWEYYREAFTVFLPDGSAPAPWGASGQGIPGNRILQQTSKILNVNHSSGQLLDETLQAFTGPLVDQNGKWVFYEVLMNRTEFEYIVENELYNQEGQAAFTARNVIDFPANTDEKPGSIELKFAWKILGKGDIPERFFTTKATVAMPQYDDDGNPLAPKEETYLVGLVGMHISVRTASAPEWIWATFEHVDNMRANSLEFGTDVEGNRVRVRPNFNNPDLPTKAVNVLPPMNAAPVTTTADGATQVTFTAWDPAKTTSPTQALRAVPIPQDTAELNAQVQALLREQGSVLQYYELIGTQWPLNPSFPAFPGGVIHFDGAPAQGASSSPESLVYKTPGKMVPVLLTNMTMETFFQQGNQVPGGPERDDRLPASVGNAAQDPNGRVFYTESCVGCHYSAGAVIGFKTDADGNLVRDSQGYKVPIYGENSNFGQTGNAHFSWLLQMKARQKEAPVTAPE